MLLPAIQKAVSKSGSGHKILWALGSLIFDFMADFFVNPSETLKLKSPSPLSFKWILISWKQKRALIAIREVCTSWKWTKRRMKFSWINQLNVQWKLNAYGLFALILQVSDPPSQCFYFLTWSAIQIYFIFFNPRLSLLLANAFV